MPATAPAKTPPIAEIPAAIETFVRGFAFTRSFTHPYLPERIGGAWVVRDAPRRSGAYRAEEWFVHDIAPQEVDALVRRHTRGRFAICAILATGQPDDDLRAGYKALGYRLRCTEPIMIHRLGRIPRLDCPATVQRVSTPALAEQLASVAGKRQILPEYIAKGSPMRQYVALIGPDIVGWVRSIVVGRHTWCSDMYVLPRHRRQGIAKALLSQMLRDDRAGGSTQAVLAASHTGALLYPHLGYEQIATLYLLSPRKA